MYGFRYGCFHKLRGSFKESCRAPFEDFGVDNLSPKKEVRAQSRASPKGSKVPNHRVFRVSILGIVMMVLGRYLLT